MKKYQLLIFDWEGTLMMPGRQLYPETKESLIQLQKNYLLAVATNRTRRSLNSLLLETGLQDLFVTTRCADETAAKPDPFMLEEILAELNLPAGQAVMIGDSEADMQMAQKIGMARIAVCYETAATHWQTYQPVCCFYHIRELLSFLST